MENVVTKRSHNYIHGNWAPARLIMNESMLTNLRMRHDPSARRNSALLTTLRPVFKCANYWRAIFGSTEKSIRRVVGGVPGGTEGGPVHFVAILAPERLGHSLTKIRN